MLLFWQHDSANKGEGRLARTVSHASEAAADFACLSSQQIDRLSLDSLQYACWSLALSSVGTWPRGVAKSTVLVVPQPIALTSGIWLLGLLALSWLRHAPGVSRAGPNGRLQ